MLTRRSFLAALAGVVAVPSLVAKLAEPVRSWKLRKVQGPIEFNNHATPADFDALLKLTYTDPAFAEFLRATDRLHGS